LIEEVAFKRIDVRLAQFINKYQDSHGLLQKTHYDLSVELGSAREVISRQLKEFEKKGWIKLSRGKIQVCDKQTLAQFITQHCD
jgi:CRP/FNR family transcriptional regulator